MSKIIEKRKMSKKAQKAENAKGRITWEDSFGCAYKHAYIQKNKKKVIPRKAKNKTPYDC